jgi:hypothetical protein
MKTSTLISLGDSQKADQWQVKKHKVISDYMQKRLSSLERRKDKIKNGINSQLHRRVESICRKG